MALPKPNSVQGKELTGVSFSLAEADPRICPGEQPGTGTPSSASWPDAPDSGSQLSDHAGASRLL